MVLKEVTDLSKEISTENDTDRRGWLTQVRDKGSMSDGGKEIKIDSGAGAIFAANKLNTLAAKQTIAADFQAKTNQDRQIIEKKLG